MNTPDYLWNQLKIKTEWKIAFWVALVSGMLTHLYMFTNNFLTWDGVINSYTEQELASSARPFLVYLTGYSSNFNLPMVIGTLSVLFLSFTAVALVETFELKNTLSIVFTSLLVVTFPTVVGTFCYLYTADGYMLAYLFSVLCFLWAERRKWGWIPGGILLALSIGTYQAYLSVTVTLCILQLLLCLLEEEKWQRIWQKIGRYALLGVSGYAEYLLSVKIMLALKQIELSGYSGTDRVTGVVLSDIPKGIVAAYRNFFGFGLSGNVLSTNLLMKAAFYILIVLCIVIYIVTLFRKKRIQSFYRVGMIVLLVALIPLGGTIYCVVYPDIFVYILLRMCWVLYFVFALVLLERYAKQAYVQWVGLIATFLMVFNFYLMSNIVYFNMNEKYEKSYALAIRIADRIEQMEEYHPWMKATFVGAQPDYNKYPTTESTLEQLQGYYPAKGDFFLNSADKYYEFLSNYLCISLAETEKEEEKAVLENPIVEQMGTFPAADSIQVIDDILVIKMSQ